MAFQRYPYIAIKVLLTAASGAYVTYHGSLFLSSLHQERG